MSSLKSALIALSVSATAFADSAVELLGWSQNARTSQVAVNYRLTGTDSMIVTLDVLTNGVSIGTDNLSRTVGDVNKIVAPSSEETRTIKWRPDLSWEGHLFTNGEIIVKAVAWPLNDPPDYMVVNLSLTNGTGKTTLVNYYPSAGALPGGITNDLYRGEMLLMRRIHAACREFVMGTPSNEPLHFDETITRSYDQTTPCPETLHAVSFTKDYYIGVFPVTHMQYDYIVCTWSSYSASDKNYYKYWRCPVYSVGWNDLRGAGTWPGSVPAASSPLGKLRARTEIDFDLPTEAQWEYACRAGTTTGLNSGKEISASRYDQTTSTPAREVMWCYCYTADQMKAVAVNGALYYIPAGLLKPNAWGLYDMHGSVFEWCLDWVDANALSKDPVVDPAGLSSGSLKAVRGVGAAFWPLQGRSGARQGLVPTNNGSLTGFRVVCPAVAVK